MQLLHVGHVPFRPESGTPYHLSVALARYLPVYYINPPLSFSQWVALRCQPFIARGDVRVISVALPGALRFIPRRQRKKILRVLVPPIMLYQLRRIESNQLVLWASNSELALWVHRKLRPVLTCYHRLDDFGAMDPSLVPLERALEKIADIILVVSPHLQAQHRSRGREAYLLPNGVDTAFFARSLEKETPIPADLQTIPAPRIGFIGHLTPKWIDFELLFGAAKRRPDWSFVMIGPKVAWKPDYTPPNFYLLGARPYTQLPQYLKGLDICLVPFKQNAITDGASPLKLYEYLAAGRAVVSTPVPDLPAFEEVVWCVQDVESLIRAVEQALPIAHDPLEQRRRVEAVEPHSWEARARTVMERLKCAFGAAREAVVPPPAHPAR